MLTDAMTTVYLVRHAHAHWTLDEHRPLSSAGLADAETLAALLTDAPIAAIYSSPSRRAIQTVAPLARAKSLDIALHDDLREREFPPGRLDDFTAAVKESWRHPDRALPGGETNAAAATRGLDAVNSIVARHPLETLAVSTHGTLLTLILNRLDASFGYEFWSQLSFPDVYRLVFAGQQLRTVNRVWRSP